MPSALDSNELLSIEYDPLIQGGPVFDTVIGATSPGKEQRNICRWDPLWVWNVSYEKLTQANFLSLAGFFEARYGRYQSFLFRRPYGVSDYRVRFNQDELQGNIDFGGVSSVQFELIEILTGTGDAPPTTFAADSGLTLDSGYGAAIQGGATFSTTVVSIKAGVEQRTQNREKLRRWTIDYGGLTLAQLLTLQDFFVARKGMAQTFLFPLPEGGGTVKCRFGQDNFTGIYDLNQTGATGSLEIVEVF